MAAIYWSIPLLVLGVSIAVVPVLYSTYKDREWEEAHRPQPVVATSVVEAAPAIGGATSSGLHSLEHIHEEVMALVARLEQVRQLAIHERREGSSELSQDSLTA